MPSYESRKLTELYQSISGAFAAKPDMGIEEMRSEMERLGDVTAEPGGVDYIETDADGVDAMWAIPKACMEDRVLLCAHAGGYAAGSMYSHRKMYAHYAKKIGCQALIVNYRLAPESPHPAQVNDMARAYCWLIDQGITSNHIAIAGDSAGGGLAITTLLRLRELGVPLPAASMPLSPWIDMELAGTSFATNATRDLLISREMAGYMASNFLGEEGDRRDPLASPLFADLTGLPPVYIQVGACEVLLDDSRALACALEKAGVDVTLEEFPGMQHIFNLLAGVAPEADEAIEKYARWVRPKMGL